MIVSSYGVHWAEGGVGFLLQAQNTQNLINPQLRCPFTVMQAKPRVRCPHDIDLTSTVKTPDWASDPLAQVMMPTPLGDDESIYILDDPDHSQLPVVMALSRLSSPTENIIRPLWWYSMTGVARNYRVTNITPLVWSSCRLEHSKEANQHIDLARASRRRLMIIAEGPMPLFGPHIKHIKTELTMAVEHEPLEAIGAGVLKTYMETRHALSS